MPRVLLSVYDKTNLADFARKLAQRGWDLVASGGTAHQLSEAGLDVVSIERLTGVTELLGGRVKTLHPAVHAGILARDSESDFDELKNAGYAPIDMVVCNLYPFQHVIDKPDTTLDEAIENIDIGGVTLLRAAAKNFARVTVIVDPADYAVVINELEQQHKVSDATRRTLAVKAFNHTRDYDTTIHAYLAGDMQEELKDTFSLAVRVMSPLRYGENPHQKAGFYSRGGEVEPLGGKQLAGKELSYNNILDADAAWRTVESFTDSPAVVIIKHLTPCGVAVGDSLVEAFHPALASDPVSAFGSVIAVNRPVEVDFVEALGSLFVEVLIAPDISLEARQALIDSRKNCRLITMQAAPPPPKIEFRSVLGGVLIQDRDYGSPQDTVGKVVTQRQPTDDEAAALEFAWKVIPHVKSNAIVLAHPKATVGVGGGLSSRVDAVELAIKKAGDQAHGAAMASDAFFPFPDGIEAAAQAGITAVIQPGGSIRDQQIIEAADAAGITMIFTGVRHFRH